MTVGCVDGTDEGLDESVGVWLGTSDGDTEVDGAIVGEIEGAGDAVGDWDGTVDGTGEEVGRLKTSLGEEDFVGEAEGSTLGFTVSVGATLGLTESVCVSSSGKFDVMDPMESAKTSAKTVRTPFKSFPVSSSRSSL